MRYLAAAAALAFAATAYADVTLVYNDDDGKTVYTMAVKGQKIRMDMKDGEDHALLFDAATQELTILQPKSREYLVMDRPTLERLQAQMRQAVQMMEQFGIDPSAMGIGGEPPETETVRTGETRTIGGQRCDVIDYVVDGTLETVACIASPRRVGIPDADWRTVTSMFEMLARMAAEMLPEGMMGVDMPPLDGVPIETHAADGSDRVLLAEVSSAGVADETFTIPAGWKRISLEMPEMPGMRGRR